MIKGFKILSILLLFVLAITSFFASGCFTATNAFDYVDKFVDDGTLVYYKDEKNDSYALCGQVNLDMSTNVYIPSHYDGKPVTTLGCCWNKRYPDRQDMIYPLFHNVDNLYLSYLFLTDRDMLEGRHVFYVENLLDPFVMELGNGPKNIFVPSTDFGFLNHPQEKSIFEIYNNQKCFVTRASFEDLMDYYSDGYKDTYKFDYQNTTFQVANTTFMFNYNGSPNEDIFFINDFKGGDKIENTPYEPLREGYTFAGWYKEPECINAWDFEKDKTPELQYDKNEKLIFVDTKLYAKWI